MPPMRFAARRRDASALQCVASFLALAVLGGPAPAHAYVYRRWITPVSGLTSDAAKWSPSGVPGITDHLEVSASGTYIVTFVSGTPQTEQLASLDGTVTFRMSSAHTTGAFYVSRSSAASSLTLDKGTLNADFLNLGTTGGFSTLYVTGDARGNTTAFVHSNGTGNPGLGGDHIGDDGISEMYVTGGGRYVCERTGPATGAMAMAYAPLSAATLSISGSGGIPAHASSLSLSGGASLTVGVDGSANLFVSNKGILDATGNIAVAFHPASNGYVSVGAPSSAFNAYLNAHSKLVIGGNLAAANNAGHGEVAVKDKGVVTVTDICEIGDPDNDAGSILRVQEGGTFTAEGGLKVWPTAAGGLDLQGGLTHVQGGAFEWPAGKYLLISSQSGSPELRIDNGITNTGPDTPAYNAQLFVGRGGAATLTVSGPGTAFSMGPGSCVVADSAGGTGTIIADTGATLSSAGPMNVGVRGSGGWYVQSGALGDVGTLAVGVAQGGYGTVQVLDTGSHLQVRDELWIGGGFGGPGGAGLVSVGLDGRLDLLHTGGVNPAVATLYAGGNLSVASGGIVATTGNVSDGGRIVLGDGEIDALSVSVSSAGQLVGQGLLATMLTNGGRVDPASGAGGMGTIQVDGSYEQFGNGSYLVDLDTAGGPQSDLLEIDGPATLAGTLDLTTAAGFAPSPGESFTLLTCTSLTGTFDAVTWNGSPLAGEAVIVYSATDVRAVIPGPTAAGDPRVDAPADLRFTSTGGTGRPGFVLDLPQAARVEVKVYDVRGRQVATLVEGSMPAGSRSFALEAAGRTLASGVYFGRAVVESGGRATVRTASAVLIR